MTEYRRFYIPNAMWFFTVNLAERKNNDLLIKKTDELRNAYRYVKQRKPFHMDAIVILPDHLHCIWTLPPDDGNFSVRWNVLKGKFSRAIVHGERVSKSRQKRRERGIWQRRLWAHLIENQDDYNRHVDCIHWNPVKHGYVQNVIDLPTGHKGLIQAFIVTWSKVFMKEIGGIIKTTRLMVVSDATDAPPNVGTFYLAHLIALIS